MDVMLMSAECWCSSVKALDYSMTYKNSNNEVEMKYVGGNEAMHEQVHKDIVSES